MRKKLISHHLTTDWLNFLRNSSNKCELIKSLNTAIQVEQIKLITTTSDNSIISIGNSSNIPNCNQEEADALAVIYDLKTIQSGF